MTDLLARSDRVRLVKLLSMLGSDHAGERDAAGLAAHRFLQKRGLSWEQALSPQRVEHRLPELGTWRKTVAACLASQMPLRPWEKGFLADLPQFQRLSVKQRYILKEIARRILGEQT
jgi:hypothetical protein